MLSGRNRAPELPKGADAAWAAAAGVATRCVPRRQMFLRDAQRIMQLEETYAVMASGDLRNAALELRGLFRKGRETATDVLRGAAVVREVASRRIGEMPYPVQLAGAMALNAGCVAEMATGEGKTLTATIPAVLAGWRGRGCHIITVNDYLAGRDAANMAAIYEFCGLTVAAIEQEMHAAQRRRAYLADITYCTNKEVCADFLRDRLTLGPVHDLPGAILQRIVNNAGTDRLVQRGLYCAIVDEADSILIDEAVTPLIISGDTPNSAQVAAYTQAAELATELEPFKDYQINQRYREVDLTQQGRDKLAALAAPLGGLWKGARRREELVVQALVARHFYLPGKQYVVQDGKIVIVDEFTGRLMPDRTWRDGLHQAVEAKEILTVNPPKETFSRISFQRFFRLYRRLAGMTGTAVEARREMWQIYHMPVAVIPTHRPCLRRVLPDRIFVHEQAKWLAVADEIKRLHDLGRPVLVGTRSVRASEHLSGLLHQRNLPHQVLNAVRHAEEAQIIAGAGHEGRVTVATNMAGRGTDIKLARGVAEKGGLHVIATERHEAARVDRQLFGRGARQGDPGSAQMFVCLDDELALRYAPRQAGKLSRGREGQLCPVEKAEISGKYARLFRVAQARATRMSLSQRKAVLQADDFLDESLGFAGSER